MKIKWLLLGDLWVLLRDNQPDRCVDCGRIKEYKGMATHPSIPCVCLKEPLMKLSRFWDLGEENIICPSKNSLYNILNALILCKGKIHDSHSLEARDGKWEHSARSCSVVFRISLPIGMESKFEELSGFKLSEPPVVGV